MSTPFTKMHGNGNDFVLIDNRSGHLSLDPSRVRRIADRRRGIGCDQLLVAERAQDSAAPIAMRIFNADGREAEQCGNGLRCFAVFARDRGMVAEDVFLVETPSGPARAELLDLDRVQVDMGVPRLEPAQIPMKARGPAPVYAIAVGGETLEVGAVSMGNPHAVLTVAQAARAPVPRLGPEIQALDIFPQGVNVGFMELVSPDLIRLRVFERGVGETLACGSGACAATVVGRLQGRLSARVTVEMPGGALEAEWQGVGHGVLLRGPTAVICRGELEI